MKLLLLMTVIAGSLSTTSGQLLFDQQPQPLFDEAQQLFDQQPLQLFDQQPRPLFDRTRLRFEQDRPAQSSFELDALSEKDGFRDQELPGGLQDLRRVSRALQERAGRSFRFGGEIHPRYTGRNVGQYEK